ncbi:hypothetical protein WMF38_56885 [Sorangium sp. So ce118]
MDANRERAAVNMLRCAARGRLVRGDWTTPTIESAKGRGWIHVDGPWMHITADGRNALAQIEEGL